jgi:hypothetical protein
MTNGRGATHYTAVMPDNIHRTAELTHSNRKVKTRKFCSIPSAYNCICDCRGAWAFRDLCLLVATNVNRCTVATACHILHQYQTRSDDFLS